MKKKTICRIMIPLFLSLLLIPLCTMDTRKEVLSENDNRMLAENPFGNSNGFAEFADHLDDWMEDRIGFRSAMLKAYTKLNDSVFHVIDNPMYLYGQEHEIFLRNSNTYQEAPEEFISGFENLVKEMNRTCKERGIVFQLAIEPEKAAIRPQFLKEGTIYDESWLNDLIQNLRDDGVSVVNNKEILSQKEAEGVQVFNHQVDPAHYSDDGAFWSVSAMVEDLRNQGVPIDSLKEEDWNFGTEHHNHLKQSYLDIDEWVPVNTPKQELQLTNVTEEKFQNVFLYDDTQTHGYFINEEKKKEGAPRILIFHVSHMLGYGSKYLRSVAGEYIDVTSYKNVVNYQYYIDQFDPDVVIFETAQHVMNDYVYLVTMPQIVKQALADFQKNQENAK